MREGPAIQRAWHRQKFARVRDTLDLPAGGALLDIGCGPGSFLGGFDLSTTIPAQELTGIDVVEDQIDYANRTYGAPHRRFVCVPPDATWPFPEHSFDAISVIEVIEHLYPEQIRSMIGQVRRVLKPGGTVIVTTPNYASHWPILEWMVARMSAVSYDEQHVTRFTRFSIAKRFRDLAGDDFRFQNATTMHFVAPFLAPISSRLSDGVATALSPRHWSWPFGALIIAKITYLG